MVKVETRRDNGGDSGSYANIVVYEEATDVSFWEGFLIMKNDSGKVLAGINAKIIETWEIDNEKNK